MIHPFLQALGDVDLALLRSISYVETLDLSGPRLLIEANDRDRILRDDFDLVEGRVLLAKLDDGEMGGKLTLDEEFRIQAVRADANENILIECLAEAVYQIKQPAPESLFLVEKTPNEILSAATGLRTETGGYAPVFAWHLLSGERPTKKIRMLARELGSATWYARGKIKMFPLPELFGGAPVATFHHEARHLPRKEQIDDWRMIYCQRRIQDRVQRDYAGWDLVEGMIGGGELYEMTQYHQSYFLDNLKRSTAPALDILIDGQAQWEPGQLIEIKFHRESKGKPFDESIPQYVLITAIASQQTKRQYQTRIKGAILNG